MSIYRATVVSFDAATWTASVRLDNSSAQALTGIKTARNIASAEMPTGRHVLLDTGDHSDPADFVVTSVFS